MLTLAFSDTLELLGPKSILFKYFLYIFYTSIYIVDLLYVTGADVLVANHIQVRFVEPANEFGRMPVGHTCGCVLELPDTYASQIEFTEEFTKVLNSNIWAMDII